MGSFFISGNGVLLSWQHTPPVSAAGVGIYETATRQQTPSVRQRTRVAYQRASLVYGGQLGGLFEAGQMMRRARPHGIAHHCVLYTPRSWPGRGLPNSHVSGLSFILPMQPILAGLLL